ncbi:uncharacterized protein LOC133716591 [Rosa rugosa]|uniref:uncharacterized protein LOC133716591 n=1 Tax=Rosa rugosa TaxID=74645 RepID=UPI002B40B1C8|nr:uncharacterized protein LOC133716591 [Rosa rugosa]
MEAMYSDPPKLIPATESSIEGLEKVRLDSLEDAVRQMPCSICMEGLDHFDAAEEGADHPPMIARLPCAHTFHADCIVQWLKTNYRCPLCRSPIVEAGEPSKPPLRLHWSMLMTSVVGKEDGASPRESELALTNDVIESIIDKTMMEADLKGDGTIDQDEWKEYVAKHIPI